MIDILKAIWRYLKRHVKLGRVIQLVNIGVLIAVLLIFSSLSFTLAKIDNKINIFCNYIEREVFFMTKSILIMTNIFEDTNKDHMNIINTLEKSIKNIEKRLKDNKRFQKSIIEKLKAYKKLDIINIDNIRKANLTLINVDEGSFCSGSHIKIKNQSYILTCAHVLNSIKDEIIGVTDEDKFLYLKLVGLDYTTDLALFKIKNNIGNYPSLEISNEYPKPGNEVLVIGNPDGWQDIITDGIIAKVRKKSYIFTNKLYFGNSGGAVLYKGKIVGVTSRIYIHYDFPIFVNYGQSANLKAIKRFLEDTFEEI